MKLSEKKIKEAEKLIDNFKKNFKKKFSMNLNIEYTFNDEIESVKLPLLELEQLQKIINNYLKYNTNFHDIKQKTRHGDVIIYRHIFCKLARDMKYTWTKIGKFLNLNHASVLHGANSITKYIKIGDTNVITAYVSIITYIKLLENYE